MKNGLTKKQQEIFTFLCKFIQENGYPPTRNEISLEFNFRSDNSSEDHLKRLVQKGYIELSASIFRGIRIINGRDKEYSNILNGPKTPVELIDICWESLKPQLELMEWQDSLEAVDYFTILQKSWVRKHIMLKIHDKPTKKIT